MQPLQPDLAWCDQQLVLVNVQQHLMVLFVRKVDFCVGSETTFLTNGTFNIHLIISS